MLHGKYSYSYVDQPSTALVSDALGDAIEVRSPRKEVAD
jgi:hypothetical protein